MFTIVKYAADGYWENYFEEDPKKVGVGPCDSVMGTYTAQFCGMEPYYMDASDAKFMCDSMSSVNPCVGYAVCPLIDYPNK